MSFRGQCKWRIHMSKWAQPSLKKMFQYLSNFQVSIDSFKMVFTSILDFLIEKWIGSFYRGRGNLQFEEIAKLQAFYTSAALQLLWDSKVHIFTTVLNLHCVLYFLWHIVRKDCQKTRYSNVYLSMKEKKLCIENMLQVKVLTMTHFHLKWYETFFSQSERQITRKMWPAAHIKYLLNSTAFFWRIYLVMNSK